MSLDNNRNLVFSPYSGEKIPKDFVYREEDKPLVDFLNNSAKQCNEQLVSKIFIIKDESGKFVGYVALGIKSMIRKKLKPPKKRGLFNRPAIVIGNLLIDENCRQKGCGKTVLKFVVAIVLLLKSYLPLRLLIVEALHDKSKKYFEDVWKFEALPDDPRTLVFDLLPILKNR